EVTRDSLDDVEVDGQARGEMVPGRVEAHGGVATPRAPVLTGVGEAVREQVEPRRGPDLPQPHREGARDVQEPAEERRGTSRLVRLWGAVEARREQCGVFERELAQGRERSRGVAVAARAREVRGERRGAALEGQVVGGAGEAQRDRGRSWGVREPREDAREGAACRDVVGDELEESAVEGGTEGGARACLLAHVLGEGAHRRPRYAGVSGAA